MRKPVTVKRATIATWVAVFGIIFHACSDTSDTNGDREGKPKASITSEKHTFTVDTLSDELENPWGLAWLPDGRLLVNEKRGEILIFQDGKNTDRIVKGFPATYTNGQGGLLDIQVHPDYKNNGWIYVTYVKPEGNTGSTTLIRFKLDGDQIRDLEELYQTGPLTNAGVHFGSRIIFDKESYVYFATGDRSVKNNSQDLSNDMGKVHRLHDDGRIPMDNPFVGQTNTKESIWSYGHRNIQGMAYDFQNDIIYATEHGPQGGDELNIVEKGKNYGWPVITYGIDYNGSIISDLTEKEGMEQPIHYWVPSIAVCGLMHYTGDMFPHWKGQIFSGALAKTHVARIEIENGRYRHEEKLLDKIGRVRQVAQGPDGLIYILTEGPGMLLKLSPTQ